MELATSGYTYPLVVQFIAVINGLYVIVFLNAVPGKVPTRRTSSFLDIDQTEYKPRRQNTSEGLLAGWFAVVLACVFVVFFLYQETTTTSISWLTSINIYGFHMLLLLVALIASVAAMYQMHAMVWCRRQRGPHEKRANSLLVFTCCAMMADRTCAIIAGFGEGQIAMAFSSIVAIISGGVIIHVIMQYAFFKRPADLLQCEKKPGQQALEVLRGTSLALWMIDSFLLKARWAQTPLEATFQSDAWPVLSNLFEPLEVLFYFHTMLYTSHILACGRTWRDIGHLVGKRAVAKPSAPQSTRL